MALLGLTMAFGYFVIFCAIFTTPLNGQELIEVFLEEELDGGTLVADIINEARLYEKYSVNELSILQFQILTPTDLVEQYFRIPPNTSNLVTKDKIDRDTLFAFQDHSDIYVDIGIQPVQYFDILNLVIHIIDVNDNKPEFPEEEISLSIPESAAIGSAFDLPAAEDSDSGNLTTQNYELLNFQELFELRVTRFSEGTHLLSLVLIDTLDREIRDSYALSLVAKDGGDPPRTGRAIVQVKVLDINDNKPEFENESYEVYMLENNDVGSTVIQVRASDLDEGASGRIEYVFTQPTQSSYGDLFQINSETGVITTKTVIDFERNQRINLRIAAKDSGTSSLTGYTQVIIIVRDLNDNAPQISVNTLTSSDQAHVPENQDPGYFVAQVSVSDPDGGENGDVTCSIDNHNFNLEEIYTTTFKITTAVEFDREAESVYTMTMTCQDKGTPSQTSRKRIVVNVQDQNDHGPAFSTETYEVSLLENSGAGVTVVQVNATDLDSGANAALTYSLQHIGLYGSDVLHIDHQNGIITTRISLDYELHHQYSYYITVHDNGTPRRSATANLLLSVLDTNDNAPVFSQPKFSFTVRENSPLNTVIGTVMAFDLDSPPYNQISYSLLSHGWDDHFNIDPSTGEIRVTTILDREQLGLRQRFELIAQASNEGYALQNSVEVIIFVEDVNDNTPVITYPTDSNNTVDIKSNAKEGKFVTSVQAFDSDVGRNGLLSYRILQTENGVDLFSIDRHTGNIYVEKDLRQHGNKEIELKIEVRDNGDQARSARASLNIYINKTTSPSEKQLVTNLTFVIGVVVASVVLVAIAVVIFVIFMMRRSKRIKKNTAVYSYRVETQDNVDAKEGEESVPTVSAGVSSKGQETTWPDVIDVNQVAFHEKPYYERHHTTGNNYVSNLNSSKRVHFKDSLESVHSAARDHATPSNSKAAFLEDLPPQGQSGGRPPVFMDEGRRKLLYGADTKALQLTSHNLKSLYRGRDGDELSDQGSSVDSGRGPSEEDQDPLRSSGIHNHSSSLNDSRESGESNRPKTSDNYIDMNQARRYKLKAANAAADRHNATRSQPLNSSSNNKTRIDSDSSFQSEPPVIPPRGAKPPVHPRTAVIHPQTSSVKTPHNFPDLNVPSGDDPSAVPSAFNSNTAIGKYNLRAAVGLSRSQGPPPLQAESTRCAEHNVVDHFPELCHRQSLPLWAGREYVEPDSRSEGGSTTSGSYMVDGAADHLDLGPEISRDVFV